MVRFPILRICRRIEGDFFFLISMMFAVLIVPIHVHAKKPIPGAASLVPVTSKTQKHFDANQDGYLDSYERLNLRTHEHFKYPLVTKDNQKPYDVNHDLMLEPAEYQTYQTDKATGKIRSVYADYKKRQKALELRRKQRLLYISGQNQKIKSTGR